MMNTVAERMMKPKLLWLGSYKKLAQGEGNLLHGTEGARVGGFFIPAAAANNKDPYYSSRTD